MSLRSVVLRDEKHTGVLLSTKDVDAGAQLVAGSTSALDPDEALKIRRKIDRHIMPLMCGDIQAMDKTTLGSAAILGIQQATHLTTNELGTVFYLGFFVFEYPQNLALQRFPVGKWMSINIFVWAIALACHAACKSFTGLVVVRFLLGACEGSVTAGFLIVSSMFYTRTEQTLRVGYWFLMIGTGQIISGFISFGTLHMNTKGFEPWQWSDIYLCYSIFSIDRRLMIITGVMTLIIAVSFWLFFPDSPTNAWFLTPNERVKAVQRIKALQENQTGVENKHFKTEQMVEALTDPKTWLFALFSALINVVNSLTIQQSLIIASFGFTDVQTTLLSCVIGVVFILAIFTAIRLATRWPNSRAYIGAISFIPAWSGILLVNLLPWSDRAGLLVGQYMIAISVASFALALSWLNNVTAGHTKRIVTNAIMLSSSCIGNLAGPFLWKAQYKPRYHIPWAVIGACTITCSILLLVIRVVLARENRIRDTEHLDVIEEEYIIERITEDGRRVEVKVEKGFLDLTDRVNRDFRYVL
ncbi:MFS general substrate transporter [Suillus paluster]|uniref:MFS general substrate transporter n=1 Tax=Suillus paluster TaxID=48578 RepID=UPI001B869BCA|nr:MFS general substrate transporter [Suillus paluster]KAG1741544.1 MFS general substrate transporter [Suillus paluster]